jgi:hypothetical protein
MAPTKQQRLVFVPPLNHRQHAAHYVDAYWHGVTGARLPIFALPRARHHQTGILELEIDNDEVGELREARAGRRGQQDKVAEIAGWIDFERGVHNRANLLVG